MQKLFVDFVWLLVLSWAGAHAVVATSAHGIDELPVLNVRLKSPDSPFALVQGSIAGAEQKEVDVETALLEELQAAYSGSLTVAKERVRKVLGRAFAHAGSRASFLAIVNEKQGYDVKITLAPLREADARVQRAIQKIDRKRGDAERRLFRQACEDMALLADLVVQQLEELLAKPVAMRSPSLAFLARPLPAKAAVRLQPSEGFPKVAEYVAAMQARRDSKEAQVRARILELQSQLLSEVNNAIAEELAKS